MTLPPGPRQAVDEAGADWIKGLREHYRYGAGRLEQWPHGRAANGQNHVRRASNQFCRVSAQALAIACAPAGVDPYVAAVSPAQLL